MHVCKNVFINEKCVPDADKMQICESDLRKCKAGFSWVYKRNYNNTDNQ